MAAFGPYTICPFDKSHHIIDGRIQTHLVKCRKNYPKDAKVMCPFDTVHMIDPEEYEHHLSICPTSGNVRCYENSFEPEISKGTVSLKDACNQQTNTLDDEDWCGSNPTYNPLVASETKNVVRTAVGLSKAKKKQFKHSERDRIAKLEKNQSKTSIHKNSFVQKQPDLEAPLRVPKKAAKAMSYNQNLNKVHNKSYIDNLVSKLKEVSLENNNNTLQKGSQESSANNTFDEKSNGTLQNGKKNASKEIKVIHNNIKAEKKPLEPKIQNNTLHQTLGKGKNIRVNSKIAATFGEARKVSTGRGFTIAYQQIKSEISNNQESGNFEDLSAMFFDEE
ncbi:PREDICTED: uncharacterized protein LOC107194608 [Dufourea novaeangliae]|nr:PREDICTED: uncharacterized protein LOC107194608 [Dufourea novaeangliae]